jgi:hypothetical protein
MEKRNELLPKRPIEFHQLQKVKHCKSHRKRRGREEGETVNVWGNNTRKLSNLEKVMNLPMQEAQNR